MAARARLLSRRSHTAEVCPVPRLPHPGWPIQVARGWYRPDRFPGNELCRLGATHSPRRFDCGREGTCCPPAGRSPAVRGLFPMGIVGRCGAPHPQNPDIQLTSEVLCGAPSLGRTTERPVRVFLQSRRGGKRRRRPAAVVPGGLLSNGVGADSRSRVAGESPCAPVNTRPNAGLLLCSLSFARTARQAPSHTTVPVSNQGNHRFADRDEGPKAIS